MLVYIYAYDNYVVLLQVNLFAGAWGSCFAVGGCGEGRRERQVWCSEVDGRTVLEVMCDAQAEPPTIKPCFTACRHHRGESNTHSADQSSHLITPHRSYALQQLHVLPNLKLL